MGALNSRKQVKADANNLYRNAHFQQLTGTPNGQGGFVGGGTWTDVAGLSNVPVAFKTWSPYEKFVAQQLYPGVTSRVYMRYRKSANITVTMRMVYGNHIYWIRGVSNYDEANAAILLYLEELQPTGTNRS
jgi:head-tail adaptor